MPDAPLQLFNSLTRQLETFEPVHPGEARVYSCGPTVYNYPHIGNMRAYVFADVLGRTLSWKGYQLTHVINITDVGHLTDDADEGEDKLEKAAAERAQSIWDIAKHYTEAYWADIKALNIRQPAHWSIATDYVPQMIAFAESIADKHCYELDSGLYFDVSTVEDYGRLAGIDFKKVIEEAINGAVAIEGSARESLKAIKLHTREMAQYAAQISLAERAVEQTVFRVQRVRDAAEARKPFIATEQAALAASAASEVASIAYEVGIGKASTISQLRNAASTFGRIGLVEGKRNPQDFAIWRKTPPGETRQMEWDSPWGRGAPGWHLECSVMGEALLGFPFDIHTGGIDHREIHHPNEIAQNQAFLETHQARCCTNGLDDPLASGARIWMHNNFLVERSGKMSKSAGEFLRLPLLVEKGYHPLAYRLMCLQAHYRSELEFSWDGLGAALTRLKRMVLAAERFADAEEGGDPRHPRLAPFLDRFDGAMSDDLNTPLALTAFEEALAAKKIDPAARRAAIAEMDSVLGLGLLDLSRAELRLRPKDAELDEDDVEDALERRRDAREARDFSRSDAIREELAARGVEVMDGDPLGWEWKL